MSPPEIALTINFEEDVASALRQDEVCELWERMAKRMIALNAMGLRLEQDSGHRWIVRDKDADLDAVPKCLEDIEVQKIYGSYSAALDHVDALLVAANQKTLVEYFNSDINYSDDLSNIFGAGTQ